MKEAAAASSPQLPLVLTSTVNCRGWNCADFARVVLSLINGRSFMLELHWSLETSPKQDEKALWRAAAAKGSKRLLSSPPLLQTSAQLDLSVYVSTASSCSCKTVGRAAHLHGTCSREACLSSYSSTIASCHQALVVERRSRSVYTAPPQIPFEMPPNMRLGVRGVKRHVETPLQTR